MTQDKGCMRVMLSPMMTAAFGGAEGVSDPGVRAETLPQRCLGGAHALAQRWKVHADPSAIPPGDSVAESGT